VSEHNCFIKGKVILIVIISYPVFEKSVEFELTESNYLFVNGNILFYFRLLKQETVFRTFSKCVTGVDVLLQLSLNGPHIIVISE
jgi:hypothetical protein